MDKSTNKFGVNMINATLLTLVKISLLSVMAFLLQFFEFPLPIFPAFLKIDVSDLPALIGAFSLGPIAGIAIELLKNLLHGIFAGGTAFIGEFANFAVGAFLVGTAGVIYKRERSKKGAVVALVTAVIVMTIAASVLNYFVFLPLYEKVLNFPIAAVVQMGSKLNTQIHDLNTFIVWSIAPFNIIKGILTAILTLIIYKRVSPILKK